MKKSGKIFKMQGQISKLYMLLYLQVGSLYEDTGFCKLLGTIYDTNKFLMYNSKIFPSNDNQNNINQHLKIKSFAPFLTIIIFITVLNTFCLVISVFSCALLSAGQGEQRSADRPGFL